MNLVESKAYTRWLVRWLGGFIALALMATMALNLADIGRDDTDAPEGRSGLGLRTDAATGCQYLVSPYGGITPRLDAAGRHLGCKPSASGADRP